MSPQENFSSYYACIGDLLTHDTVCAMQDIPHHFFVTCYEHSVFVSYVAFRIARRLGADYREAARAGLLHDLYLYDPRDRSRYQGNQCFAHPKAALKNAAELCGDLSPAEENSILTYSGPSPPICRNTRWPILSTWPTSSARRWRYVTFTGLHAAAERFPSPNPHIKMNFLFHFEGSHSEPE